MKNGLNLNHPKKSKLEKHPKKSMKANRPTKALILLHASNPSEEANLRTDYQPGTKTKIRWHDASQSSWREISIAKQKQILHKSYFREVRLIHSLSHTITGPERPDRLVSLDNKASDGGRDKDCNKWRNA